MKLDLNRNKTRLLYHILYWVIFILFFSVIWGSYDDDYFRNFMVQLLSLPARLVLVYVSLLVFFPLFFLKDKLALFIIAYVLLLIFCTVGIQRAMIIFIVEGTYLPYHSEYYFNLVELTNTMMDVNIAAIIPIGSKLVGHWMKTRKQVDELKVLNQKLSNYKNQFLLFKKGANKHKVFLTDIVYLESLKNNIKVVTLDQEYIFYGSISNLEKILKDKQFLRIHRSFIININYVKSFSSTHVNVNHVDVPIGRKFKPEVVKLLKA